MIHIYSEGMNHVILRVVSISWSCMSLWTWRKKQENQWIWILDLVDLKFEQSSMNKCETSVVGNVVPCHVPCPRNSWTISSPQWKDLSQMWLQPNHHWNFVTYIQLCSILFLCGSIMRSTQLCSYQICSYQICMCRYEIKQFCEQCSEFRATFYWKVFIQTELFSFNGVFFFFQTFMFASFLLFEIHRLTGTEETVRAASKRLTQGMANFNKAISSAKTEEEKTKIVSFFDLVDWSISCNNLF